MPRGAKRPQAEILKDQLEKIDEKITKLEEKLKEAKEERKSIEQNMSKVEFDELLALMQEKNISVAEIRKLIEG